MAGVVAFGALPNLTSLHPEQPTQASGNQDGWMIVPLQLSEPDLVRRLQLSGNYRPRCAPGTSSTA